MDLDSETMGYLRYYGGSLFSASIYQMICLGESPFEFRTSFGSVSLILKGWHTPSPLWLLWVSLYTSPKRSLTLVLLTYVVRGIKTALWNVCAYRCFNSHLQKVVSEIIQLSHSVCVCIVYWLISWKRSVDVTSVSRMQHCSDVYSSTGYWCTIEYQWADINWQQIQGSLLGLWTPFIFHNLICNTSFEAVLCNFFNFLL